MRKKHPLYSVWINMKQRCYNKNRPDYKWYGAEGITVCDRWLSSFDNFVNDMGDRPDGYTIDRIDNNLGYFPSNCKWSSMKEQVNNRREKFRSFERTAEHCANISKSMKGKLSGELHPMYGKKHSADTIAKMSFAAKDKTIYKLVNVDGSFFEGTQSEFKTKYNVRDSSFSSLLSGAYKSTKGWRLLK